MISHPFTEKNSQNFHSEKSYLKTSFWREKMNFFANGKTAIEVEVHYVLWKIIFFLPQKNCHLSNLFWLTNMCPKKHRFIAVVIWNQKFWFGSPCTTCIVSYCRVLILKTISRLFHNLPWEKLLVLWHYKFWEINLLQRFYNCAKTKRKYKANEKWLVPWYCNLLHLQL